jgi:hypothetical protein
VRLGDLRVMAASERLIPRGYPEQPDDGTWENEGGYVARRNPTAFVIEEPSVPWFPKRANPPRLLVLDAETWAELQLKIEVAR